VGVIVRESSPTFNKAWHPPALIPTHCWSIQSTSQLTFQNTILLHLTPHLSQRRRFSQYLYRSLACPIAAFVGPGLCLSFSSSTHRSCIAKNGVSSFGCAYFLGFNRRGRITLSAWLPLTHGAISMPCVHILACPKGSIIDPRRQFLNRVKAVRIR
jgi:hypothetical protein